MASINITEFTKDLQRSGHPSLPLLCRIRNHPTFHYTFEGERRGPTTPSMFVTFCATCGSKRSKVKLSPFFPLDA